MALPRIRIFISSPGDVAEERVLANRLVRRLSDEFAQQVWVEPVFWEHEPLLAHDTFQAQIPKPSESEIVVCILWSRLGTRLPSQIKRPDGSNYASGTEYEFEDAVEGRKRAGSPDLLVYRKTAEPLASLKDKQTLLLRLEQKEALDTFINKWFIDACDGTLKAAFHAFETSAQFEQILEEHLRKLVARRINALPAPESAPAKPSWTDGSPFRGLDAFDAEHAAVFFGRTRAIGDVLTAIRAQIAHGRNFVMITGVSGGGKSSLVRAGVVPLVTQAGVIEGVGSWRRAVFQPGGASTPIAALAKALLGADGLPEIGSDGTTADSFASLLRDNVDSACALIKTALSRAASASAAPTLPSRLLLVVDQLEELFTATHVSATDRNQFVSVLSALAHSGNVLVLATIRSDFYHRCAELPQLIALKEGSGQYDLLLASATEIGQMIRNPARAAGLRFEEDPQTKVTLDESLRDAAAACPESLPLLEFALEELYRRRAYGNLLTFAAYRELGGVEGALATRAEQVFASLPPGAQEALANVFRGLVTMGESSSIARRQCPLDLAASTPDSRTLVEALVAARLLTTDRTNDGVAVVRVAHEALLRNWPRVLKLLEQDKELLLIRTRVSAAADRWEKDSRRSDLLLSSGKPLEEAVLLSSAWSEQLSAPEKQFITSSARHAAGRHRMKRAAIAALVMLTISAISAAGYAARKRDEARANEKLANANAMDAQRRLGESISAVSWMYQHVLGLRQETDATQIRREAMYWCRNEAQKGNAVAMYRMGLFYEKGLNVDRDIPQAAEWYRKASDAGYARAMNQLGFLYLNAMGSPNYPEALRWIQKAVDAGNPNAMDSLAMIYRDGLGVAKDDSKAIKWYAQAVIHGNRHGLTELQVMSRQGRGSPKDYDGILQEMTRAAGEQNAAAMTGIGWMHQNAIGVPKDDAAAMKWYRKAADLNNGTAMTRIGEMYESGVGVARDYAQALNWYRKAADVNDEMAMLKIGAIYEQGLGLAVDYAQAMLWYQKASDANCEFAMDRIGNLYAAGKGVTQDYVQARSWYAKGLKREEPDAIYHLAVMYAEGKGGAADVNEAEKLMAKAANAGSDAARQWLQRRDNRSDARN